jgi:hypothetical protein
MSTIEFPKLLVVSTNGIVPSATPAINFDGTNTINSNVYSVPVLVKYGDRLGLQVSAPATGTPSGTITMQGSNDLSQLEGSNGYPDTNVVNWSTVSFFDELTFANVITKTFAGAESLMFSIANCEYRWWRFLWTNTSGSALLTARLQVKSEGGR